MSQKSEWLCANDSPVTSVEVVPTYCSAETRMGCRFAWPHRIQMVWKADEGEGWLNVQ